MVIQQIEILMMVGYRNDNGRPKSTTNEALNKHRRIYVNYAT